MNRRSLRGSLRPGRGLDAARHVDAPRPHERGSRRRRCRGVSPPASRMRTPPGAPSASRQSKTRPEPGSGESTRMTSAGLLAARRERGIAGRERLDHELHPLADPPHLGRAARGRAAARRAARRAPTISTIRARALVAEHADGVHLARQPPHDVADGRRASTCRAARREHEAERVGAERDREQRVVLVRDPADLDEHASATGTSGVDQAIVVEVVVGLEVEEAVTGVVEEDHPLLARSPWPPAPRRSRRGSRGRSRAPGSCPRRGRTAPRPRTSCPAGRRPPPCGPLFTSSEMIGESPW